MPDESPDVGGVRSGQTGQQPLLSVLLPMGPGETQGAELQAELEELLETARVSWEGLGVGPGPGEPPAHWRSGPRWRWLASPPGRAVQLNLAAARARGTWLWILHADTRLSAPCAGLPASTSRDSGASLAATLSGALSRDVPERLAYFPLRFRQDGPRALPALMKVNELGARLRCRWPGTPYGDQGFLLPRALFWRLGGFSEAAPYGEDHLLVWRARQAGVPVEELGGAWLTTSARKYRKYGWLRQTLSTMALGARQAWPEVRAALRAGTGSRSVAGSRTGGLAIFVKTPGLSPVKTRLHPALGEAGARELYVLCARAVQESARQACARDGALTAYWAVAEAEGLSAPDWQGLPRLLQCPPSGRADLGERLHRISQACLERHSFFLLIGADSPQLDPSVLERAALHARSGNYVIQRARDGGFTLFGGPAGLSLETWRSIPYSQASTAERLVASLPAAPVELPVSLDLDEPADLAPMREALRQGLGTPEQLRLLERLDQALAALGSSAPPQEEPAPAVQP